MSKNYQDWCYLNEEGIKEYGNIFSDRQVPILSMIPIMFNHPKLENPESAYLLRGTDLTEVQLEKLIEKISSNFDDPNKDEIKKYILANQLPLREKLTSGAGTKRIFMYLPDYDSEHFDEDDWDEEDWDEDNYDPCW